MEVLKGEIAMRNPLKQGLKLLKNIWTEKGARRIAMRNPLKQGLKLRTEREGFMWELSQCEIH